jgi:hypothetical protein
VVTVDSNVVAIAKSIEKSANIKWNQDFDLWASISFAALLFFSLLASHSDVNSSSTVVVKIFDRLESNDEDGPLIGEVRVNIADVFDCPFDTKRLSFSSVGASVIRLITDFLMSAPRSRIFSPVAETQRCQKIWGASDRR